jgi:hypothetical protein
MRQAAESWNECLGLAFKDWREGEGFELQQAAASHYGIPQCTWSRMESGSLKLNMETLEQLGCPADTLYRRAREIAIRDHIRIPTTSAEMPADITNFSQKWEQIPKMQIRAGVRGSEEHESEHVDYIFTLAPFTLHFAFDAGKWRGKVMRGQAVVFFSNSDGCSNPTLVAHQLWDQIVADNKEKCRLCSQLIAALEPEGDAVF